MRGVEDGRGRSSTKVMFKGVTSESGNELEVVAAGIINGSEFEEQIREKGGDACGEEQVIEIFAFLVCVEARGVIRFGGSEGGVASEEVCVNQLEAVSNVGERREIRMTFKVELRGKGGDVIHDVVQYEAEVGLDVNRVVIARIEFDIGGQLHSTKVVGVRGGNGRVIVLKYDGSELLCDGGECGGGTDLDRGDAGGSLDAGSRRHVDDGGVKCNIQSLL